MLSSHLQEIRPRGSSGARHSFRKFLLRNSLFCLSVFLFTLTPGISARANGKSAARKSTSPSSKASSSAAAKRRAVHPARKAAASAPVGSLTPKELESLARGLKGKTPDSAYAQLSGVADAPNSGLLGARAALALGYFDYSVDRWADAEKWFARAKKDALLGDYTLYWQAEADIAQQQNAVALAELQQFRKLYPNSVMTEQALQALSEAAMAANQPAAAVEALNGYMLTPERPALLFARGEAHEAAQQLVEAAADYQSIFTHYALSDQSKEAGIKLDFLRSTLGDQVPQVSAAARMAHADAIFGARQWSESRSDYTAILPQLAGADRERAQLRIMEAGVTLGAGISELVNLQVTDPDVDAERLHALADYYRGQQQDAQMVLDVEAAATRAPASSWTDESLFLAGNYYWVQLDRDRASGYYQREEEQFPNSTHAAPSQWRVAWTAVLKRAPNAADLLAEHVKRFPGSAFTPDALYWLGRLAEERSDNGAARAFYAKLADRYPGNFFDQAAMQRPPRVDPGPVPTLDVLAAIPPLPGAAPMGATIPQAAAERQSRADALRSIAFDASAELELRAAYASTGEPRFLVEAAQADVAAEHWGAAIVTLRQVYPQIEARPYESVPPEAWRAAYPLPHVESIRQWSTSNGLDPMLIAGLSRQESAFDPNARSSADALGVMQLLPKTARLMARQEHVRYSTGELFDADYNIHLGTAYFAGLKKQFGSVEAALAAYNAGEDHVNTWTATPYRDIPEFVDSIPFTETREYVEIITRNAFIYRRIYATPDPATEPAAKPAAKRSHGDAHATPKKTK
jgi:soluble lytic murein transglycosylase